MSGVNRLPAPAGSRVDHDKPVSFTFEGQSYTGLEGDNIASALAANDVWLLSRSFKYHRPRGVMSMAGLEADTLVQVGREPNAAADHYPIAAGLKVSGQNYTGSLQADRETYMDKAGGFLPVGFYYKAFFRPKGIWQKIWEPLVRRKAGLGRVHLDTPHGYYDKAYGFYDVAVVGSGPAGMSAALVAAQAGAQVLLIEQEPTLGGALGYARLDVEGKRRGTLRDELAGAMQAQDNIEVMTGATCNGWFADNWLPVIRGNRMYKVRATELILATGAMEQPAIFRYNDLPGVMLGSAAQRLIRLYGVRPGKRAVVLTGNSDGYGVALDLIEAGIEVASIVDMRAQPKPCALSDAARDSGIRIVTGHTVFEAHSDGKQYLGHISVAHITGQGQCASHMETIDCDLLCMSPGYTPAYQLALQAGGKISYDDASALFSINGLPDGMTLAGALDGAHDLDAALTGGQAAGAAAARRLGLSAPDVRTSSGAEKNISPNFPWPIFPHPKGKEFVDRDEDLQIRDIVNACADGYAELELVKRYSTVGMGPSQGRHSALATARLVAHATQRNVAEIGVTTARPPLAAEKLGVLAGRSFEPERFTAMHHRHLEAGAQMMTAGLWWRPAYYGAKERRDACIREEVLAVRNNVGVIDVSTLGGLEVRGKDAAEFLNRVYTFAYAKQPAGKLRYVLMTNETGTIIDDGVACRLDDEHFYVTATTGGVDNVYRTMLWWNAQWRLDVDITNVTAAYAGVSIAGPTSRELLRAVCEDVDLSTESFPYLGVRAGTVAGIPARILRVGFVGELGYEAHVPASCGEALWDALLDAGKQQNVSRVGIEAQRVLRLEKGHIIIGQDTDAMTSPYEVHMGWAVAENKPFFVGGRSLQLRQRQPAKRSLVGFTIDDTSALPEESNLVLDGDNITGQVTSVARSPVLDKVIGLAYAPANTAQGSMIEIKLSSGEIVKANVSATPFYDPENKRQDI